MRKKTFERKLARDVKKNPKPFYSYINNNTKVCSKVGPLKDKDGKLQTDDLKMSGLLNDTLTSVFTSENTDNMPNPPVFTDGPPLSDFQATDEMVSKKMNALNPGKSQGPDEIHPKIVKNILRNVMDQSKFGIDYPSGFCE